MPMNELRLILSCHLSFYYRHPLLLLLLVIGLSAGSALITAIQGLNAEASSRYSQSTALIERQVSHLIKPLPGQQRLDGQLWLQLRRAGFDSAQPVLEGRIRIRLSDHQNLSTVKSLSQKQALAPAQTQKPSVDNNQIKTLLLRGINSLQWLGQEQTDLPIDQLLDESNSAPQLHHIYLDQQLAQRLQITEQENLAKRLQPEDGMTKLGNGSNPTAISSQTFSQASSQEPSLIPAEIPVHLLSDLGPWALMDIALADQLLQAQGQLSYIELSLSKNKNLAEQLANINAIIQGLARLIPVDQQSFDTLSEAFFFNLSALALLGYVVAAFLSYNAIRLALSNRKTLLQQLWQLGCQQARIQQALLIELLLLSLISALIGSSLGYLIANLLVLDINTTLINLYDLDRALQVQWQPTNLLIGFVLNLAALSLFLVGQLPGFSQALKKLKIPVLLLTAMSGLYLYYFADSPLEALLLCGIVLVLFILLTPLVLTYLINLPLKLSHPLLQWLKADCQDQLKVLSVAIQAILIALGAAIGMHVMVGSFSQALEQHLEQRLSADFYIRPPASLLADDDKRTALRQNLEQLPEVTQIGVYQYTQGLLSTEANQTVSALEAEVVSYGPTAQHFQQLALVESLTTPSSINIQSEQAVRSQAIQAWHIDQGGCLANEPAKLKYHLTLGQHITIQQQQIQTPPYTQKQFSSQEQGLDREQPQPKPQLKQAQLSCQIRGFYYDYGDQHITIAIAEQPLQDSGLQLQHRGFSVSASESPGLFQQLKDKLNLPSEQIVENARFKQLAKKLFADTFSVTQALNGFIIAIALVGIWVSFLTLSANQLQQLALLSALGVTQRALLLGKLLQTGLLILFTLLIALPLGIALGWVLLKFIMPIAFGWSMPMELPLQSISTLLILVLLAALSVAAIPLIKLTHRAPADSLASL